MSTTRKRRNYSPLHQALLDHIEAIPFDKVFFVSELQPIAERLGYSSTELAYAMAELKRRGITETCGRHKKGYENILHLRRCRNPKDIRKQKTKSIADYQREIAERAQRAHEASMRLWNAMGMPTVQQP